MITHKWIDTAKHSRSLLKYYSLYRYLITILPIEILRNPFDASDGIWIVGEKETISRAEDLIVTALKNVETAKMPKVDDKDKRHGNKIISDYRDHLVRKILEEFYAIAQKEGLKDLIVESKIDKPLRYEYIKETPSLRILKPFR